MLPERARSERLARPVKWHRFESVESYAARLFAANLIDDSAVRQRLVKLGATTASSRRTSFTSLVEDCGGRERGHYANLVRFAQPLNGPSYQRRYACRLCAAGQRVEQVPHDRENVCLRHGLWIGPGTTPETQFTLQTPVAVLRAERRHRRHTATGRFNADLTQRAWEMLRDAVWQTSVTDWPQKLTDCMAQPGATREVQGRAALYDETVRICLLLTDKNFLSQCLNPAETLSGLRKVVAARLPFLSENWTLVERVVLHLQPARRRAQGWQTDQTWATPRWWHEQDLSGLRADGWSLSVHETTDTIDVKCIDQVAYEGLVNSLPAAVIEWDWEANGNTTPWTAGKRLDKKRGWICVRGHRWSQRPSHRMRGIGCPYCSNHAVQPGFNDLATVLPDLAAEWDVTPGANNLMPSQVVFGSTYVAAWQCVLGHRWKAKVDIRRRGSGCPYCTNALIMPGFNDLVTVNPELAAQWDDSSGVNTLKPSEVMPNSKKRAAWRCQLGHTWMAEVFRRNAGAGCPVCTNRQVLVGFNDLAKLNPKLAAEWDHTPGANNKTPEQVVATSAFRAQWRCLLDHTWTAEVRARGRGLGCPYCKGKGVLAGFNDLETQNPQLAAEWDTTPGANSKAPCEVAATSGYAAAWRCSVGHEWRSTVHSRAAGSGCPICSNKKVLPGVNDLGTVNPSLASEWDTTPGTNRKNPNEVTFASGYRAAWKCREGHQWTSTVRTRARGCGCPYCARQRRRRPKPDVSGAS